MIFGAKTVSFGLNIYVVLSTHIVQLMHGMNKDDELMKFPKDETLLLVVSLTLILGALSEMWVTSRACVRCIWDKY